MLNCGEGELKNKSLCGQCKQEYLIISRTINGVLLALAKHKFLVLFTSKRDQSVNTLKENLVEEVDKALRRNVVKQDTLSQPKPERFQEDI